MIWNEHSNSELAASQKLNYDMYACQYGMKARMEKAGFYPVLTEVRIYWL
jgi:hypothetical protein